MQEIEIIRSYLQYLIENKEVSSQQQFGASLGYNNKSSFSQLLKRENVSNEFIQKLKTVYPDYVNFYNSKTSVVREDQAPYFPRDKKQKAIQDLNRITNKSKNGNSNQGRFINDDDLIPSSQYIIPLKGQAGLKKAFFYPDEYIETNFEKEIIYVKPSERGTYYKIEVDGNSMVGKLDPGDWTRCEDVPKMFWIEKGTFKPEKIYCLIHRTRGILFKRISKMILEQITLTSDNPDKVEFPDETFDLNEFSKILIVRKIEKDA